MLYLLSSLNDALLSFGLFFGALFLVSIVIKKTGYRGTQRNDDHNDDWMHDLDDDHVHSNDCDHHEFHDDCDHEDDF